MAQYIDKSAIVAEIKRRIALFQKEKKTEKGSAEASQMNVVSLGARIAMLEEILPFLDTLEVKEVNLEKELDCPQNHQDCSRPNGCIVLEDFNGGEGFYKLSLDYLNKKQVEEVEEMVRMWNNESKTSNEVIKNCIGMCLTDVCEQRFKDYNTSLKDCLAWLEKQGEQKEARCEKCKIREDKCEPLFDIEYGLGLDP